jgi:hypothetical protein
MMKKWCVAILGWSLFFTSMASGQGTGAPVISAPTVPAAPVVPGVSPEKVSVYSFLEWKSARVHEAQQKLETLSKSQIQGQSQVWQEGKSVDTAEDVGKTNEQKLTFNVDVALQLNIHDYFSMYLKMLSLEEFKEATKKLTDDEKSELLLAYKNSQDKEKKLPLKFSKSPKDNAKSKSSQIQ